MGLPEVFIADGGDGGGGVIQGSVSEATAVAVLAARTKALKHMRRLSPNGVSDGELLDKMTLYTSDQVMSLASSTVTAAAFPSSCRRFLQRRC